MSQEAFAKNVGMNRGNIASYEKGTAEPGIEKLLTITQYFQVPLIDFVEKDLSQLNESSETDFSAYFQNPEYQLPDTPTEIAQLLNQRQKIIEGLRAFYEFNALDKANEPQGISGMPKEYERILEVAADLLGISQHLFNRWVQQKNNAGIPTSSTMLKSTSPGE